MGKSIKKSATKVDVAPVAVTQSGKKGKRGAENEIEKALSAKKQKVERDETVIAKQKAEKKKVKKVESSSEDDSDSDSDSEPKVVEKKTTTPAKNGSVVAKKPETSSDSSSDSESEEEEKPAAKKVTTAVKNGSVAAKKHPAVASDSSDSSDDDSDDEKPAASLKNGANKKPASSSDESDDDSDESEEEEPKKVTVQPKKDQKKSAESSDDSDDESSDEDVVAKAAPAAAAKGKVDSVSSDDEEDSSDSEDEPKATKPKVQAATKSDSSDEESSDDDEEEDQKTPKKKDTDVEMVDAQKSAASNLQKTPKTPEATGSKTLFAGNLSFDIQENDVREFFKEAGEVVDVRFALNAEGQFKGFGHVEFATAEAAKKGLEFHQKDLLGRPVRLDLAHERGAATPNRENNSFQKGGRAQGTTAFIRGFDTSLGEDDIRSALQEHFGVCGESTRISIPPDHESGGVKGMAYIDFVDSNGLSAALELDGSDLGGGYYLTVQEAKPRGDSGGRFDRGSSGGRSGGRRGRDGGRGFGGRGFGGRDSGGRGGRFGGGRGGRDGGRGGRAPFRNTTPSGKKTTFGDD